MPTGQDVVDEVRIQIHDTDPTAYRWTDAELLGYINAGQRQIVTLVPEANTVESTVDFTAADAGIARRTLPAGGIKFIRATNNLEKDGANYERQSPLRYAEKDALDSYDPTWEYTPAADADNYFKHYCHERREPKVFYLFPAPPNTETRSVGIVHSAVPADLTDLGDDLSLDDAYFNAYVTYVTFRALSKEARQSLPSARQELWENFLTSLGMKKKAEMLVSPENNAPPEAG